VCPLSHRFEVIDGLGRFDFHDTVKTPASARACEHDVRITLAFTDFHRRFFIAPDVDRGFVAPTPSNLELPDDAIVHDLLSNWA